MQLIDVLKKQKVHLMASTVFKYCEEDFSHLLEMKGKQWSGSYSYSSLFLTKLYDQEWLYNKLDMIKQTLEKIEKLIKDTKHDIPEIMLKLYSFLSQFGKKI